MSSGPSAADLHIPQAFTTMAVAEFDTLAELRQSRPRHPVHTLQPPLDPLPEFDHGHQLRPPARLQLRRLAAPPQSNAYLQRLIPGQAFEDGLQGLQTCHQLLVPARHVPPFEEDV